MTSAQAWQNHGCYSLGSSQYYNFPLDKALHGCEDDWNSLDHRDPSASVHNIVKAMYHLRLSFPALNDGLQLEQLSNLTSEVLLPGSNGTATEVGIWSMSRAPFDGLQDFSQSGGRNDPVWLVFTNLEVPTQFEFDCADAEKGLYAPFEAGATVQNLFFPYEEYTIGTSNKTLFVNSVEKSRGCIESLDMPAWGFKALVRKEMFVANRPAITKFTPGHDARLVSTAAPGLPQTVDVGFVFTQEMDCDSLKKVITFSSRTEHSDAVVKMGNATCGMIKNPAKPSIVGEPQGVFEFKATLENVYDGIHTVSINNATASNNGTGVFYTKVGSLDRCCMEMIALTSV